MLEQDYFGASK